jgi:hypothetical protein
LFEELPAAWHFTGACSAVVNVVVVGHDWFCFACVCRGSVKDFMRRLQLLLFFPFLPVLQPQPVLIIYIGKNKEPIQKIQQKLVGPTLYVPTQETILSAYFEFSRHCVE